MPYASNHGVRIYYLVEGEGVPIILQHGSAGSHQYWYDLGYVKELSKDYRVITPDARGCGKSDKPHEDAAYALKQYVGDFVAILDDLKIKKSNYLGYSMGGRIGYHVPMYAPGRFHSLIIGGAVFPALGRDPANFDDVGPAFVALEKAIKEKRANPMEAFVAVSEKNMGPRDPRRKAVTLSQDPLSIIAAYHARRAEVDPKRADYLPTIDIPVLLYCGEADPRLPGVKECLKLIKDAEFFSLPGLNHSQVNDNVGVVIPQVKNFLAQVSKGIKK